MAIRIACMLQNKNHDANMPYIQRDEDGKVVALTFTEGASSEFLPVEAPEILQLLAGKNDTSSLEMMLDDLKLIRIIEDLIDILVSKNIIIFSELPLPVQKKILLKKGQRDKLFGGSSIIGSEEGIL